MSSALILAIDQGTSSSKCLLVDASGAVVRRGQAPLGQMTPKPGWIEQDAEEILASVRRAVAATVPPEDAPRIVAIGISAQRESCLVWDRRSGAPLTPVLSWQDQRTAALCEELRAEGHAETIYAKSGLPLDPMFSAAKAKWLLAELDPSRARARSGEICVGTIDAFLLARLAGEAIVECGHASRMQLLDVRAARFDDELLAIFDVPAAALPRLSPSIGPFPAARGLAPLPDGVPIGAVMADSHAALFAHGVFDPGPFKATHGTGASIMGLIDRRAADETYRPPAGLCLTLAWQIDAPALALEANIRSAGATLAWAAEMLGVDAEGLARLAAETEDSDGVVLAPAFGGLGAPWWDSGAVAVLAGFTLTTRRAHVARAALDSIAHQIADVIDAVRASGAAVERLHVDGGPTRNAQLMQFEADMIGAPVAIAATQELSALGAAHLAGVAAGLFTMKQLSELARDVSVFHPAISAERRAARRSQWRQTIARSRGEALTAASA